MNKNIITLFTILIFAVSQAFAQATDEELQTLVSRVSSLRQGSETAWNTALDQFINDDSWTIMDEIPRHDNECWLLGDKQFKLNAILKRQYQGHDAQMVAGDFLNGNDPNYNYSLTERGVKKQSSVNYEMSYREGKQTYVVMPYKPSPESFKVEAFLNGKPTGTTAVSEGNIVLSIDSNVKKSDTIRLVITNLGNEDMPVVIINHNTRMP